jgi:hypothetical protein
MSDQDRLEEHYVRTVATRMRLETLHQSGSKRLLEEAAAGPRRA